MNPVVYIVPALVAVGVLAMVFIVRRDRARAEALAQACEARGLVFEPAGEVVEFQAVADLPLFRRGHSRKIRNVMAGRIDDSEIKVFDYAYTSGAGQHSHTRRQTVAILGVGTGLPDFVLAPEHVFHRIGQAFGYQDIDFDESPEFSSTYQLRGRDETAIRALFRPATLSFFAGERGWTVEASGGHVGVFRSGRRCKPEDLETFLYDARRIARTLRESYAT